MGVIDKIIGLQPGDLVRVKAGLNERAMRHFRSYRWHRQTKLTIVATTTHDYYDPHLDDGDEAQNLPNGYVRVKFYMVKAKGKNTHPIRAGWLEPWE